MVALGPVIGKVTESSAVLLLEVGTPPPHLCIHFFHDTNTRAHSQLRMPPPVLCPPTTLPPLGVFFCFQTHEAATVKVKLTPVPAEGPWDPPPDPAMEDEDDDGDDDDDDDDDEEEGEDDRARPRFG